MGMARMLLAQAMIGHLYYYQSHLAPAIHPEALYVHRKKHGHNQGNRAPTPRYLTSHAARDAVQLEKQRSMLRSHGIPRALNTQPKPAICSSHLCHQ